jgi:hypothetical protein
MAQVYISPSPYNDAFKEVLDLRKFNIDKHRAAGMSFIWQDSRLILGAMVPSTPGARVPRWRTRIKGAWLISVDNTPVLSVTDVQDVFRRLYADGATSCTLLFSHPDISHGLSQQGVPLLRRDQLPQTTIDMLSDRWALHPDIDPDLIRRTDYRPCTC